MCSWMRHANRLVSRYFGALSLASVCVLSMVAHASAHSGSRPVTSLLDEDASGALAVCLGGGLAARSAADQPWRFICPTMFQGVTQDPCDAMPGGGIAVGTMNGLWIVKRDGTIGAHPDPAATGRIIALASSGDALYALRARDDLSEVLLVTPDRIAVIFSDKRTFSDLGAGPDFLQLMRLEPGEVGQVLLSPAGAVMSDVTAEVSSVDTVVARPLGDVPYVAVGIPAPLYQLGRIDQDNTWHALTEGAGNLAGPVELADGTRLVASAGQLGTFDAEMFAPFDTSPAFVTALHRLRDRTYACTIGDIREVTRDGLGTQLFSVSQLFPPDLTKLADPMSRASCSGEWAHYAADLLQFGLMPASMDVTAVPTVMSTDPPSTAGVGAAGNSGGPMSTAGQIPAPMQMSQPSKQHEKANGCSVANRSEWGSSVQLIALLALCVVAVAPRRRAGTTAGSPQKTGA